MVLSLVRAACLMLVGLFSRLVDRLEVVLIRSCLLAVLPLLKHLLTEMGTCCFQQQGFLALCVAPFVLCVPAFLDDHHAACVRGEHGFWCMPPVISARWLLYTLWWADRPSLVSHLVEREA